MSTYTYKTEAGQDLVAPKFEAAMTAGFVRRHRNDQASEQMFALVEEVLSEDALAIFDTLPAKEVEKFFVAWQEDSGITAGE